MTESDPEGADSTDLSQVFDIGEWLPAADLSLPEPVLRMVAELRDVHDALLIQIDRAEVAQAASEWEKMRDVMRNLVLILSRGTQLVRRVDRDADARLQEIVRQVRGVVAYPLAVNMSPEAELRRFDVRGGELIEALGIVQGVVGATLIDGPALGASSIHVTAVAGAHAEASAIATAVTRLDGLIGRAKAQGVPDDLLKELEELRTAAEKGDRASLVGRLIKSLEGLKPWVDLATELLKIGGSLAGG